MINRSPKPVPVSNDAPEKQNLNVHNGMQEKENVNNFVDNLIERRATIWNRMFPNAMEKVKQEHLEKAIAAEMGSRIEKMRIIGEAQKQALTEVLNSELVRLKIGVREEDNKRLMESLRRLIDTFQYMEENYMHELDSFLERIQRIRRPELIARLEEQAMGRMEIYLGSLMESVQRFRNIQNEFIESGMRR
ncbi:MAG: hypothetical protein ACAI44_39075 [Candidatus Sericytochromatia bacterium]